MAASGVVPTCSKRWRWEPGAVLIGRPLFWGLAVDGEAGLRAVLQMLRELFQRWP